MWVTKRSLLHKNNCFLFLIGKIAQLPTNLNLKSPIASNAHAVIYQQKAIKFKADLGVAVPGITAAFVIWWL